VAWQKAGIIKPGGIAVVGEAPPAAMAIISAAAREVGAPLLRSTDWSSRDGPAPALPGQFQSANARIALATVDALRCQGYPVSDPAVAAGLAQARLPGRLERMPSSQPVVWIDGAHNADKMTALASALQSRRHDGPTPVVLLGMLADRDAASVAGPIAAMTSAIVTTQPAVVGKRSLLATDLAAALRALGYRGRIEIVPDPVAAIDCAESVASQLRSDVLVAGSLYLAGQVRGRWYADDEIVVQRTPWPS
jgi:dihydrofolate synthase/folylpolyglutamate synthase